MNTTQTPTALFTPENRARVLDHMNGDHADAVLRYARHFAGHVGATAARLIDIDAEAILLSVTLPEGEVRVRIPFAQPLAAPEDAHQALVAMAKEARRREALARACETTEWFRRTFKTVLLGTTSAAGEPDASVAPAVFGDDGAFYVYVSALSAHTRNLLATRRASVLLIEDEAAAAQLLARRRLTFPATAELIPRESPAFGVRINALKEKFGGVMSHLETMTDFQLVRLEAGRGRLVNGFGKAYDVDPRDWTQLTHVGAGGHGHHGRDQTTNTT
jgi:heme iron utilization protein